MHFVKIADRGLGERDDITEGWIHLIEREVRRVIVKVWEREINELGGSW